MMITREDAIEIFMSMGRVLAIGWSDDVLTNRLNSLDVVPQTSLLLDTHELRPALDGCLKSIAQGQAIKLGPITAEEDLPKAKVRCRPLMRRSPGTASRPGERKDGRTLHSNDKKSRGWWAGYIIATHADKNNRPYLPNDYEALIKEIDDNYVDSGGKAHLKESKWYLTLARAILAGYFQHLDERAMLDEYQNDTSENEGMQ